MKSSFRFIYVVAIVVVIMIIVTLGLFVMKNSQEFVRSTNLTKNDIDEFNALWKNYEGLQKGSTLKGLFLKLKNNAQENKDNASMLIDVAYNSTQGSEFKVINSTTQNPNIEEFDKAKEELLVKHTYMVKFIENEAGQIVGILIQNNRNDKFEFTPNEK